MPVNLIDPATGKTFVIDEAEAGALIREGWQTEDVTDRADRLTTERKEEDYGGVVGKATAGGAALLRGVSGGLSDVAFRALGEEDEFRNLREVNPGISTAGEIIGAVGGAFATGGSTLAATPAGAIARLGTRLGKAAEGAGAARQFGRAALGAGVEGGLSNVGSTISDLALSEDPLDIETMASELGSSFFAGAGIGAGTGILAKAAQKGLTKAKGVLDDVAARREAAETTGDLAQLDGKGLRAAEKIEIEAIEAGRVTQRAELADEIGKLRTELKDQKLFLATKGAKTWGDGVDAAIRKEASEIGKVSLEADKAIDRMLRNPKALAARPGRVLDALQQQDAALERLIAQTENLKPVFAADESGERLAALAAAPAALERNRALQGRIAELAAAPSSTRLSAIMEAKDAIAAGGGRGGKGLADQMVQGSVFGAATGLAASIPILGQIPGVAPLLGAKAASMVSDLVFGRLGKATGAAAQRTAAAVQTFLDVGRKVAPAAPVLATKVLAAVAYAPPKPEKSSSSKPAKATLATLYKSRAEEIRSQTMPTPAGPQMRPEARAQMAERLKPIASMNAILADRMETLAARRLEFLAARLPRKPELDVMQIGPDRWQPSDMEMRTFARYAAAVEDPGAIEERLAAGRVSPEDAEVMREVYPERLAELTRQIVEQLPALQKSLPYHRRLALSILTGVNVDPSMHPEVLAVLQSAFEEEAAPDGGAVPAQSKPQFGSVKNQEATASQERQGATA